MSEHALMKKGEATMNVPPEKVQAFEADGWIVINPPAETPPAPVVEEIKPEAETPVEKTAKPKGRKSSRS